MYKLRNRGQSNLAMIIASTAIVLFITIIVLGKILTMTTGLTGEALAAQRNVTAYTWIAVTLVAVGLLVVGGMGLVGMVGFGGRRR